MSDDLFRPIVGIENRTAQEVFDIMCDRINRNRTFLCDVQKMHRRAQIAEGAVSAAIGVIDAWLPAAKMSVGHDIIVRAIKTDLDKAVAKARQGGFQ